MPAAELPALAEVIEARLAQANGNDRARRIALVGLRGAGKSTLGRMLAQHFGWPLIELDRVVERDYGASIPDLIEMAGIATFRRYERSALERVIAEHEAAVITTAGGIVANPETYALLLRRTHTVWIKARPDEHMSRVMAQGDFRPMAQNRDAMADLVAILDARQADYARAGAQLDTSDDTVEQSFSEAFAHRRAVAGKERLAMRLADTGFLDIGAARLEYRMIGPRPDEAPTIVMLHEGLGCVGLWGDFPDKLAAATGAGVFVYSRAGYGQSSPVPLPRPLSFMHDEARDVLPRLLDAIGFQRGLLLGHSDGASIAAIYAGSVQDHRVRGLVLIAPHFFTEDMGIAEIERARRVHHHRSARQAGALARRCRLRVPQLERAVARSGFPQMGHHRGARLYPRADPDRAGRGRPIRHGAADRGRETGMLLPGRSRDAPGTRHAPTAKPPRKRLQAVAAFVNRLLHDHHEGDLQADQLGCFNHDYNAYYAL